MSALHPADAAELDRLLRWAGEADVPGVLGAPRVPPGTTGGAETGRAAIDTVAAHCRVDHVATLVFPATVVEAEAYLLRRRWTPTSTVPSVVVRRRLADRYGLDHRQLDVSIVHASAPGAAGVELFCLPPTAAARPVLDGERRWHRERHTALLVEAPSERLLDELRSLLTGPLAMRADGGGHNPHEGPESGGRTVLYFRPATGSRLELTCRGDFTPVVARHLDGER
ncbi:hypothetical protein ACWD4P_33760 [Kitasatospora sp. NPDC002543]